MERLNHMKSFKIVAAGVAGFVAGGILGCLVGIALSIPFLGMIMILTVPSCGVIGAWKGALLAAEAIGKHEYGFQLKNYLLAPNKAAEILVFVPFLLFALYIFLETRASK